MHHSDRTQEPVSVNRPLGRLTMDELVDRVMPSWSSTNDLAQLAFELTMRRSTRAVELLGEISSRLRVLGVELPKHYESVFEDVVVDARVHRTMDELQSQLNAERAAKSAAELRIRELEKDAVDASALNNARGAMIKVLEQTSQFVDRFVEEKEALEEQLEELQEEANSLKSENRRLKIELDSARRNAKTSYVLDAYFVSMSAPLEFIQWSQRFWRMQLHPDRDSTRSLDLTKQYQEMERAFRTALQGR